MLVNQGVADYQSHEDDPARFFLVVFVASCVGTTLAAAAGRAEISLSDSGKAWPARRAQSGITV